MTLALLTSSSSRPAAGAMHENPPMKVVALFRVSTEKQAADGASLDAQQRTYRDMATKQGWETVAEFKGSESATQAASDRRVLQQVLSCIRDQTPDAVYVHEQSRLTRGDELEVALLMRELKERRIKIIVGGVVRDLASIDERFMVGIQSLVDRAESERIKERMVRGKRERAKQGKKNSGPTPFGYANPPPGATGRGTLQIVPDEAVVVRKIFDLAASGKGAAAIATTLSELGITGPRGGKWGKTSVDRMLANPGYIGTHATGVWVAQKGSRTFRFDLKNPRAIIIENAHPPIITREVWDAVHHRARVPRALMPRLLTGLLHVNGESYGGDSSAERSFYRASRGVRGCAWLFTDVTDSTVWDAFALLATSPELVQKLMAQARSPKEQMVTQQEVDYLKDQVGKARRRLDRLVEMRADGEIGKDVYHAKCDETKAAIQRLETELGDLTAKSASMDGTHAARVVRAVQCLIGGRTILSHAQKRSILNSIVRRIDVAAVKTNAAYLRDAKGHITGTSGSAWAIKTVSFRLAVSSAPLGDDAAGGVSNESCEREANQRPRPSYANAARHGQLDLASIGCGQLAAAGSGTQNDTRCGHLDLTSAGYGSPRTPR